MSEETGSTSQNAAKRGLVWEGTGVQGFGRQRHDDSVAVGQGLSAFHLMLTEAHLFLS